MELSGKDLEAGTQREREVFSIPYIVQKNREVQEDPRILTLPEGVGGAEGGRCQSVGGACMTRPLWAWTRRDGTWGPTGGGAADSSPFPRLQPAQAADAVAAGEDPPPREAMKVKKGGGGTGTGAEPAPGASNRSVEPTREPRAESESGSESEPEPGPGPRVGPLQGKQPIGPDDVLGLQRITGGEHRQGSATRGLEGELGRGPTRLRVRPPRSPFPHAVPLLCVPLLSLCLQA